MSPSTVVVADSSTNYQRPAALTDSTGGSCTHSPCSIGLLALRRKITFADTSGMIDIPISLHPATYQPSTPNDGTAVHTFPSQIHLSIAYMYESSVLNTPTYLVVGPATAASPRCSALLSHYGLSLPLLVHRLQCPQATAMKGETSGYNRPRYLSSLSPRWRSVRPAVPSLIADKSLRRMFRGSLGMPDPPAAGASCRSTPSLGLFADSSSSRHQQGARACLGRRLLLHSSSGLLPLSERR